MERLGAPVLCNFQLGDNRRPQPLVLDTPALDVWASGRWRSILLWFVTRVVWLAYQGAEIAATGALGSLSLSGSDGSAEEQQVIAFWALFLLLHLGGPDTMAAYALEDSALSVRKFLEMVFQVGGAFYAQYKYIYRARTWTPLATASAIMLPIGIVRYVEKWYALWKSKSMMEEEEGEEEEEEKKKVAGAGPGPGRFTSATSSNDALCLAQDLFHVCRRALSDSSVLPGTEKQRASEEIFLLGWERMCKVVEMELSLMYEALYTKAIVLHTCPVAGYLNRLVSPLATAAAVLLFNQYIGSRSRRAIIIRRSFVDITYLLLVVAFAMDLMWLLRALGSTWTYAALREARPWAWWLRHHLLCSGRWRRIHRAVDALHPLSWLFGSDPVSYYRTWSGTIGRYNLLQACSVAAAHRGARRPWWTRFGSWLEKKLELEETEYLRELPQDVKESLIQRVQRILVSTKNNNADKKTDENGIGCRYTLVDIRTLWGQQALEDAKTNLFGRGRKNGRKTSNKKPKLPSFGREFEEDVLMWHMATCILFSSSSGKESIVSIPGGSSADAADAHVTAIKVMSEYLMFFVAVRRHMLPGLVLHSLLEKIRQTLHEIWDGGKKKTTGGSSSSSSSSTAAKDTPPPQDRLAEMLLERLKAGRRWFDRNEGRLVVGNAAALANTLIETGISVQKRRQVPQLLEFIFNVWVDKLLYAAARCSVESHAKQLSRGGDLTTILWLIAQHAGLFRIGELKPKEEKEVEKKEEEEEMKSFWPRSKPAYPVHYFEDDEESDNAEEDDDMTRHVILY
jgi:hypothetical protein